jgi:ABC-type bacteriocin/lantibiotic exporter with double-glycine peptidase domain
MGDAAGSGKSTIFRLLLGFEKPESGTLRLSLWGATISEGRQLWLQAR